MSSNGGGSGGYSASPEAQQLHEVTQLPLNACERILSAHNGNLQAAMEAVLSNAGADGDLSSQTNLTSTSSSAPSASAQGLRRRQAASSRTDAQQAQSTNAVAQSSPGTATTAAATPAQPPVANETWRGFLFSLLFGTFRAGAGSMLELLLSFVGSLVPGLDLTRWVQQPHREPFAELLPELAGTAAAPHFRDAEFDVVKREAYQACKPLLVYLHAPRHADAPEFVRDALCNEEVVQYLNDAFVLWGCNVETPSGRRMARALQAAAFPFVGVLMPQASTPKLVGAIQGTRDPVTLLQSLRALAERVEPLLVVERTEREQRMQTQRLREEQDQAYRESLRKDQERQRAKEEEERKKREAEEAARQAELEEQRKKEEEEQQRQQKKTQLPEEPHENEERVRIAVKLPDGSRVLRCFRPTEPVQLMYDFVFSHHEQVSGKFTLYTMRPRRALTDMQQRIADLCPNNAPTMFSCHLDDA